MAQTGIGLLHGYNSDASSGEPVGNPGAWQQQVGSSSSSDRDSEEGGIKGFDRDYGDSVSLATSSLPGVDSVFSKVSGPPTFLDPEATRQQKVCAAHLQPRREGQGAGPPARGAATGGAAAAVARLAPRLKGMQAAEDAKASVITAAPAKRTTLGEGERGGQLVSGTALAAMLGGNMGDIAGGQEGYLGEAAGPGAAGPGATGAASAGSGAAVAAAGKRKGSKAMEVTDFLARGHGGAQLPRKKQDRKDRERSKRGLGQSSHAEWKSEAEMVLRQQYDS